jgi:glutamine synthetase
MLLENVRNLKEVFSGEEYEQLASARKELIKEIGGHISNIKSKVKEMVEARKKANVVDNIVVKSKLYNSSVLPFLEDIRSDIDKLELIVDNELWPLPKYRELLFVR